MAAQVLPGGSDEAHYDLAPAVEKALLWVPGPPQPEFIGTESRLNTIFDLLRQMVYGAEEDPERRLAELRRRRAEIDEEIARAERGDIDVLDAVSQRDRYQQFARTARELLADFRQVEENFRRLDRSLREQIAGWAGSKGELLDDGVRQPQQHRRVRPGAQLPGLLRLPPVPPAQAELTELLERLHADRGHRRTGRAAWHVSTSTGSTPASELRPLSGMFSEQLGASSTTRCGSRIGGSSTCSAPSRPRLCCVRDEPDPAVADGAGRIRHCGRPAHGATPVPHAPHAARERIDGARARRFRLLGHADQIYVDRDLLAATRAGTSLGPRDQVGLAEVVADDPLEQGLAELVGYLSLAEPGLAVIFDEDRREQIRGR